MSGKDITEKLLESYNDVFADIVNVLLFDGRRLVREDALDDADRLSEYKAADELHGQERDVAKFWRGEGDIRICLYGLENQTGIDTDIPLRVVSYDGAGYRAQLLADKDKDYNPPQETVRHVHEVLHLMAAVSGNRKFEEALRTEWRKKHGTGGNDMIDIFEKWRKEDMSMMQTLMSRMLEQNRIDDLRRASEDSDYLQKLLVEEGIGKKGYSLFWGDPRP